MPCAPGPRNPGQFCSVFGFVFEASVTAGRAIRELARNERRDNPIEFPCVSSFISFICSPLSNLCSRYYITGELRNQCRYPRLTRPSENGMKDPQPFPVGGSLRSGRKSVAQGESASPGYATVRRAKPAQRARCAGLCRWLTRSTGL